MQTILGPYGTVLVCMGMELVIPEQITYVDCVTENSERHICNYKIEVHVIPMEL